MEKIEKSEYLSILTNPLWYCMNDNNEAEFRLAKDYHNLFHEIDFLDGYKEVVRSSYLHIIPEEEDIDLLFAEKKEALIDELIDRVPILN
jgi:hypothetical protein